MAGFWKIVDEGGFFPIKSGEGFQRFGGEYWLLEIVKDGKVHEVERWSPDYGTPSDKSTEEFLRISRAMLEGVDWAGLSAGRVMEADNKGAESPGDDNRDEGQN